MFITKKVLLIAAASVWLSVAVVGLFFASKSTERPFDPTGSLYLSSNQIGFDEKINGLLSSALNSPLNNTVVHITSENDCLCQLTASRHIKSVKDMVTSVGKENKIVYIEKVNKLSKILTSTPAVAVFDDEGRLSYLGPYSTGIGCLSGNGTVEPYIAAKSALGAIVPLESTGCYCSQI